MSLRPGSQEAKALFALSVDEGVSQVWLHFHNRYAEALQEVAKKKKRPDLVDLDHFLHNELPGLVIIRSPKPHVTHEELAKVMKWKLARGKMRPLQKVVESNSSAVVVQVSTKAIEQLTQGHWDKAFVQLCELRGIGTATASALLSFLDEAACPFMADEVIDAVYPGERDYTMKIYEYMRPKLIQKAHDLNELHGQDGVSWTAEAVGRALWTCAQLNLHLDVTLDAVRTSLLTSNEAPKKSTTSKKRDNEVVVDEPDVGKEAVVSGKRRRK